MKCVLSFAIVVALAAPPALARAEIAQLRVAPNATFREGILRVERFGRRGRPIVFVPALFCGPWQWSAQINAFSKTHIVLAVTLPGFDGLPSATGGDLMRRAADSLHELIVAQRLQHTIVVGHSLGGTLAVYFAETYANDTDNVVTVEGGYPIAPTQAARNAAVAKTVAPYQNIGPGEFGAVVRKDTLQYTITRTTDVDAVQRYAERSDPSAVVAWMRAALLLDLTPELHRIAAAFTAIVPFDPQIDPYQGYPTLAAKRAAYRRWVSNAPRGELIVIDRARHFVMFDRPAAFAQALAAAVAR